MDGSFTGELSQGPRTDLQHKSLLVSWSLLSTMMMNQALLLVLSLFCLYFTACESVFLAHVPHILVSGELLKTSSDYLFTTIHLAAVRADISSSVPDIPNVDMPSLSALNLYIEEANKYPLLPFLTKLGEVQAKTIKFLNDSPEVGEGLVARYKEVWGPVPGNFRAWTDGIFDANPGLKGSTSELASSFLQRKGEKFASINAVISKSPLAENWDNFWGQPATVSFSGIEKALTDPLNPIVQTLAKLTNPLKEAANNFRTSLDTSLTGTVGYLNAPPTPYQLEVTGSASSALESIPSLASKVPDLVGGVVSNVASQIADASSQISEALVVEAGPSLSR